MRCKTCDYPLWNLPARKCPECGTDFKPSDFHFIPNSVRFLCPHCEQCYYGTTPEGRLIPRTFNCVKCAQRIDMDEMLLFPAEGVQEQHTAANVMPWLERQQLGWFKGWVRTIGMAMASPHKLMRAIPMEGGLGEATFFTLATHGLIALIGVCIPILLFRLLRAGGGVMSSMSALEILGAIGGSLVGGAVGMLVFATLWALLTHGLLKISGGAQRGIGRTMLAFYYSSGVNIIMIVPCIGPYCGGYFIWIWWMVSAILMVMEGQKVSGLRATLCVGAGPVLGILAFVGYIVLIATIITGTVRASGAISGYNYTPNAEARSIHASVMAWAAAHNGQGPAHGIELVPDTYATAANFAIWQIGHDEASVTLPNSNTSLDAFQYLPSNRMQMMAQSIAQGQPANVVAHRLGDVVFTYHGMNLSAADPQLWIAIIHPDPGQPQTGPSMGLTSMAVLVDGSTLVSSNTPQALQQQNALRAKYGLPPLPDPSTVTNSLPATGNASGGAPSSPPG